MVNPRLTTEFSQSCLGSVNIVVNEAIQNPKILLVRRRAKL